MPHLGEAALGVLSRIAGIEGTDHGLAPIMLNPASGGFEGRRINARRPGRQLLRVPAQAVAAGRQARRGPAPVRLPPCPTLPPPQGAAS